MVRRGKTVAGERAEAAHHLAKAQQFLDVARASLRDQRCDASMLNAIHAGISAADAVTMAVAGERSADPDHQRAVNLLEEIAGGSEVVRGRARQLRMLIQKKNAVEYESRRASRDEAAQAVERAERVVAWARDAVESGRV
jgi:hypothetical protein